MKILKTLKKIIIIWINFTKSIKNANQYRSRDYIEYKPNSVPIAYDVDVLVVGAGVSGLAAAISSGRSGVKTLLIEKQSIVGGLVTGGWVTPFSMQMMLENGELITRGLVEELFDRISDMGGTVENWRDWKIPKLQIDPEIFKYVVIDMLKNAGVKVILNTPLLDVIQQNKFISEVIIHNKAGFQAIRAKQFIDCSGEADLARLCGVPCTLNADVDPTLIKVVNQALKNKGWVKGTEKTASLQFVIGNVNFDKTHDFIIENPDHYASTKRGNLIEDVELFSYLWKKQGFFYLPHETSFKELIKSEVTKGDMSFEIGKYKLIEESGLGMDGLRSSKSVVVNANRIMLNPFNEEDVSNAMNDGQEVCFEIWKFLQNTIPGFENSSITAVASYMGIRRGAQIIGDHVYTAEERMECLQYKDSIGMASRKTEKAYEVPFSLMLPIGVDNLLVASGKTVSTDDFLPYRTKPTCMILGQAAGAASALCIKDLKNLNPRDLDIRDLQKSLIKDGVYLGDADRLKELNLL